MRRFIRWFPSILVFVSGCSSSGSAPSDPRIPNLDPALGWEILLQDPVFVAFNRHPERVPGGIAREMARGELPPERALFRFQAKPQSSADWEARFKIIEFTFSGIVRPLTTDPLAVRAGTIIHCYDEAIPDGREVRLLAIRGITNERVAEAIYPR